MANNISMRRVQVRIQEMFQGKIDMADIPNDTNGHFETRALAAFALIMISALKCRRRVFMLQMVTMIWELMRYIWMKLRKNYLLFKVNGDQTEVVPLLKTK